jgi:hypothetical protein
MSRREEGGGKREEGGERKVWRYVITTTLRNQLHLGSREVNLATL